MRTAAQYAMYHALALFGVALLDRSGRDFSELLLDAAGSGACDDSVAAEGACSLNADATRDAEDPRVAAGSLIISVYG